MLNLGKGVAAAEIGETNRELLAVLSAIRRALGYDRQG
jgi:hypothetical protein